MNKERFNILIKNLVPAVLSTASIYFISLVDGIIIGKGANTIALGGINLAIPFVVSITAVNLMISVGGATISSVCLGKNDKEGVDSCFQNTFVLITLFGIITVLMGTVFIDFFIKILNVDAIHLIYTKQYIFWWAIFGIFLSLYTFLMVFGRIYQFQNLVAIANIIGMILNIFLDYVLVFPLKKGVAGSAFASGFSTFIMFIILLSPFIKEKIIYVLFHIRINVKLIIEIIYRGLPIAIIQFKNSVLIFCMNYVFLKYIGNIAVDAFAIVSFIITFVMAIFNGASSGLQPLFGKACGENNNDDLKYYYKAGNIFNISGSVFLILIYLIFGKYICMAFGGTNETLNYAYSYLWKFSLGLIFAGCNFMLSAFLYSTKQSKKAIIINVINSFILDSIIIITLPIFFGKNIIIYSYCIYELIALIVGYFIKRINI